MATIGPDNRLHVVVGVLENAEQEVFIQQRRPGTPKPGMWEFPGGKVEHSEPAEQALKRELMEELGIEVQSITPLTVVTHDYDHARVYLEIFLVDRYAGEVSGKEGQAFAWTSLERIAEFNILPAVPPIVSAIKAWRQNTGDQAPA